MFWSRSVSVAKQFLFHLQEAALSCDKLLVQDASDFLVETVIIKMVREIFLQSVN